MFHVFRDSISLDLLPYSNSCVVNVPGYTAAAVMIDDLPAFLHGVICRLCEQDILDSETVLKAKAGLSGAGLVDSARKDDAAL